MFGQNIKPVCCPLLSNTLHAKNRDGHAPHLLLRVNATASELRNAHAPCLRSRGATFSTLNSRKFEAMFRDFSFRSCAYFLQNCEHIFRVVYLFFEFHTFFNAYFTAVSSLVHTLQQCLL